MEKGSLPFQLALYTACCFLVVVFVHLYGLFSLFNRLLPTPVIAVVPIAAVLSVLVFLPRFLKARANGRKVHWPWVLAGVLLCIFALTIPDGRYPVKRIHVLEYMALSCLVRYAMSWRLHGGALLFFSVLASMAFGIHDELLQGIHPQRTYGLRDISVNAVASLGGGLIWHGGALFGRQNKRQLPEHTTEQWGTALFYLAWLVLSTLGFIVPLAGYDNVALPYWMLLPLSAALVFWAMYNLQLQGGVRYGCLVVSCLAFSLFCYPVVINAVSLSFH